MSAGGFSDNHLRDVLVQLEEQAAGYAALGEPAPWWLRQDIDWLREQIGRP